jgi:hypothetical protein
MSKLIRLDGSGHTTLAEWKPGDVRSQLRALRAFRAGERAARQRDAER